MKEAGRRRRTEMSSGLAQRGSWCLAKECRCYPKGSGEPANFSNWGITQSGFHFWKITVILARGRAVCFFQLSVTTDFLVVHVEPR